MAIIIMSKPASKLEPSLKKKAYAFLEKLGEDDTSPGLHIEPIAHSADDKVRTGRVDQFYRAVLFRVPSSDEPAYVFYGIWPHDDAIAVAKKTRLALNPVNGVTEITTVAETPEPVPAAAAAAALPGPLACPLLRCRCLSAWGLTIRRWPTSSGSMSHWPSGRWQRRTRTR